MTFRVSGKKSRYWRCVTRSHQRSDCRDSGVKYFDGGYSGHLTLARDGFGFRTECAIHILDPKINAACRRHGARTFAQRRPGGIAGSKSGCARYHRRLKRSPHRAQRNAPPIGPLSMPRAISLRRRSTTDEADGDVFTPVIIAESTTTLKQLSVSDAVTELDLTGAPVLVFRHAAHGGNQYRLSPCRRPFRLDRPARSWRPPMPGLTRWRRVSLWSAAFA